MKDINENKQLFTQNAHDNYDQWLKPWLATARSEGNKYIDEFLDNADEINKFNNHHEQIMHDYEEIDNAYKTNKIKQKKAANITIIVFSCLIVGLFFLGILVKNKKVIKEFETMKDAKLAHIQEENNAKNEAMTNIFQNLSRLNILNRFLDKTGLYAVDNIFGSNIESYVRTLGENVIGLKNFGVLKAGSQNVYVSNFCHEYWKNVTTSGSVSVPYTVVVHDSDGGSHTVTRYETVVAYHYEPTPFRSHHTLFSLGLRPELAGEPIDWTLNCLPPSKNEDKVDYLKKKKISKNKKDAIESNVTFEDPVFNNTFDVEITNADGSIAQQQAILSWFTNATQSKFVEMRKDFIQQDLFSFIDQDVFKAGNCLNVHANHNLDMMWFNNTSILDMLNYDPKASLKDNVQIVATQGMYAASIAMINTCEFLNFSKANSLLTVNPISYDYSLMNPGDANNDNKTIDPENILVAGNNCGAFVFKDNWKSINNFVTAAHVASKNVSGSGIVIDNYYTTREIDHVQTYASQAHRYVDVPVPYEQFHADGYSIMGFGLNKLPGFDLDGFKKYLDNEVFSPETPILYNVRPNQVYFYMLQDDFEKFECSIESIVNRIEADYFTNQNI